MTSDTESTASDRSDAITNVGDMAFCPQCGTKLPDESTFCPGCGVDLTRQLQSACRQCGAVLPEDSAFCPGCGAPVEMDGSSASTVDNTGADNTVPSPESMRIATTVPENMPQHEVIKAEEPIQPTSENVLGIRDDDARTLIDVLHKAYQDIDAVTERIDEAKSQADGILRQRRFAISMGVAAIVCSGLALGVTLATSRIESTLAVVIVLCVVSAAMVILACLRMYTYHSLCRNADADESTLERRIEALSAIHNRMKKEIAPLTWRLPGNHNLKFVISNAMKALDEGTADNVGAAIVQQNTQWAKMIDSSRDVDESMSVEIADARNALDLERSALAGEWRAPDGEHHGIVPIVAISAVSVVAIVIGAIAVYLTLTMPTKTDTGTQSGTQSARQSDDNNQTDDAQDDAADENSDDDQNTNTGDNSSTVPDDSSESITYPPYPGGMTENEYHRAADLMLGKDPSIQSIMTNMVQVMDCKPSAVSISADVMPLPDGGIRVSGSEGNWTPDPQGMYCVQPQWSDAVNHWAPFAYDTFVPLTREQIDMNPQDKQQLFIK